MKYLGIDYGDSKVGLAIADSETGLALPYRIISGKDWQKLFIELSDIVKAEKIEVVVIGIPIDAQKENISAQESRVRQFIDALRERLIGLEFIFYDERFSTQAARKLGAVGNDDDVAAMVTLQNYLDGLDRGL